MDNVPFLELRPSFDELDDELRAAFERVMKSGWYLLGEELEAFEAEFADYCETSHCVGVGSGLDALTLTLRALDISCGDEVIVPGHTFIATWLAVSAVGATPVAADVELDTMNVDVRAVEAAISPRTRAIVAVHLYGQPADMKALAKVSEKNGLALIEDAAQAHGARYDGRRVGGLGQAAAFSFYPGKNLGAFGDGGAVVTEDANLAARVRSLRNYGSSRKYHHQEPGVNSRLDELQAGFLRCKLQVLDDWNARRTKLAERYSSELANLPGVFVPAVRAWAEPAWHLFVLRCVCRETLVEWLQGKGLRTQIHYPIPPHQSEAYANGNRQSLPNTERLAREVISLPMGPHLAIQDAERVCHALWEFSAASHSNARAVG